MAKDRAQFPAWVQAERIEAHDSEKLGAAGDPGSTRLAAGFKRKIPLAPYSASSAGQRACWWCTVLVVRASHSTIRQQSAPAACPAASAPACAKCAAVRPSLLSASGVDVCDRKPWPNAPCTRCDMNHIIAREPDIGAKGAPDLPAGVRSKGRGNGVDARCFESPVPAKLLAGCQRSSPQIPLAPVCYDYLLLPLGRAVSGGRMQNDDGDKTRAREYRAPTLYDYGSLAELTASGTRPHDESAHPGYCPGGWDCYLLKR